VAHTLNMLRQRNSHSVSFSRRMFRNLLTSSSNSLRRSWTEEVLKKLGFWASAAPVAVGMAEKNRTKPTIHDPHHCKDDMCFEQWAYKVGENKFGLEKDGQLTKRITTNISGNVEATQYCYDYLGIISCTSDVENGHKLKRFMWFGLKEEGKGLIAQLYWADKSDLIGP